MNRIDRYIAGIVANPNKRWVRYLLLEAAIFLVTANVLWDAPGEFALTGERLLIWLAYFAAMNGLLLSNIRVFAARYLLRGRINAYIFSLLAAVLLLILLVGAIQSVLPATGGVESGPSFAGTLSSVAAVALLLAGTSTLVLFRQWIAAGNRRSELESATLRAELDLLNSQINPHFLFNMLNNCHLLVKKERTEAAEVLYRLEELLRYQIGSAGRESVGLDDEEAFVRDFLRLEKIRRDRFDFTVRNDTGGRNPQLPPLLFIPFVENAVKHNQDSENGSYVDIRFYTAGTAIGFRCVNSVPRYGTPPGTVGGIGLANIRRRLELLFPGRHELAVSQTEDRYTVELTLEL